VIHSIKNGSRTLITLSFTAASIGIDFMRLSVRFSLCPQDMQKAELKL